MSTPWTEPKRSLSFPSDNNRFIVCAPCRDKESSPPIAESPDITHSSSCGALVRVGKRKRSVWKKNSLPRLASGGRSAWDLIKKEYGIGPKFAETTHGTYIRKGMHKATGQEVALKCVPRIGNTAVGADERREAILLSQLDHNNIIKCFDAFEDRNEVVLVLELCEKDLLDYNNEDGPFSEEDSRVKFTEIMEALVHSHERRIVHRDIKLENIFMRADGSLVLADFGLARAYTAGERFAACGTICYAAPELYTPSGVLSNSDPEAADVFAMGVVLYALVTRLLPFGCDPNDPKLQQRMRKGTYHLPENLSAELRDLIRGMLNPIQDVRLKLHQVMSHPWMMAGRKYEQKQSFQRRKLSPVLTSPPLLLPPPPSPLPPPPRIEREASLLADPPSVVWMQDAARNTAKQVSCWTEKLVELLSV